MKNIFFAILFLWSAFSSPLSAKVWINELMQSNIDLVRDDLQEFPDSWIELYNDSDSPVNIQNWHVSLDANYWNGWKINVSYTIPAKSYRLIYADKANMASSTGLHTDYRVDSGSGGAVYLFDASGNEVDKVVNIPKQPAPNIAFGRLSDGSIYGWGYYVTATPGASNQGKTSSTLLPAPVFSQVGGIFKSYVKVSLSLPADTPTEVTTANIHYTTNNTEPTVASPVYTGELTISNTTIVRAKLIHPDYLTNWSTAHTYIISTKNFPLPVISISTDPEYLNDPEFGIYVQGNGKYGKTGNCIDYRANWNNDWRRPINFEYFLDASSPSVINQLGEFRIAGGCSRTNPQKTFVVYGNKRFGPNKRYDYDFWKEKPGMEIKSFMIRNSGNDFWYTHFRDAAMQLFFGGKVDVDYQAYQPAIFYLNGEYWGIQNLRERSDEDWVLANYATEDIDMFENWWDLKAGDWTAMNQLTTELKKPSAQRDYQWIMNQIDLDEFTNYMILQVYIANTDFLSDYNNNTVMWRHRQANSKWRFLLKDTDFGMNLYGGNPVSYNPLNFQYNNDTWKLFTALLTQDSFKKNFYRRYAVYMGDLLHYNSTSHVIDSIKTMLEPAIQDHLSRWGVRGSNINSWRDEISRMKTWGNERNAQVYGHIRSKFGLGTVMSLTYKTASDLTGNPAVFINDVRMRSSGLNGSYFQSEPINLRYDGNSPSYGWKITKAVKLNNTTTTTTETFYEKELLYTVPSGCTALTIELVNNPNNPNSLTKPEMQEISFSVIDNQLQISDLQLPSVISIYDITGKLVEKITTSESLLTIPVNLKGVFIVKVQNDAQRLTQKVVI